MDARYKHIIESYPRDRSSLVPLLLKIQEEASFLSPESIREVGQHIGLTDNEIYSLASFYPRFLFSPPPDREREKDRFGPVQSGELQKMKNEKAEKPVLASNDLFDLQPAGQQVRVALRHCGLIDPEDINDYLTQGGYSGLARALRMTPDEVEAEVSRSGLEDDDGSVLSLERRWRLCRGTPGKERYLIGHGAPSDPVSLTERSLLEGDPHAVLEGMLIAAYVAGASRGILYVDSRFSLAFSRLRMALRHMEAYGYLGVGILGSEFSFHIRLSPAAGPLACGEAAELISALEGRRPMGYRIPANSVKAGFLGHPTVIHPVETLARLSAIFEKGADWYAGLGLNGHQGTKIFTLAGRVRRPGLVEVQLGTPLRDMIDDIGGGIPDGETFKAVQVGGPTGGWLSTEGLDIPLDVQTLAVAGVKLGSGSLVVAGKCACAVDLARQALVYARTESCGHCLFCREGTRQMAEILADISEGRSKPEDLDMLMELSEGLKLGSSCCQGRTAPDAFLTTLRYFRKEYEAHLKEKRCPAGVCRKLTSDTVALSR
jgi:NADH-quinone oxidoreductase subunit F